MTGKYKIAIYPASRIPCSVKQRGFSLIELTISMAIVIVVLGSAVGIFISMVHQQQRVLQDQELLNQVSYAIEYMGRALRMASAVPSDGGCMGGATGDVYVLTHCTAGAGEACSGIKIYQPPPKTTNCQEFYLDTDNILKEKLYTNGLVGDPILSSKFVIKSAKFIINGDKTLRTASLGNGAQPRVTMLLDILTPIAGVMQEKVIQTTVSLRNLNTP